MRYMCIAHADPTRFDALTESEKNAFDARSQAYDKELEAKGHYVIAEAIEGSDSAVLVRVRNGKAATSDGPYMETKEQMAGFILIEARDMNEAIRLATGIPMAELGTVEVRPVLVFGESAA